MEWPIVIMTRCEDYIPEGVKQGTTPSSLQFKPCSLILGGLPC